MPRAEQIFQKRIQNMKGVKKKNQIHTSTTRPTKSIE